MERFEARLVQYGIRDIVENIKQVSGEVPGLPGYTAFLLACLYGVPVKTYVRDPSGLFSTYPTGAGVTLTSALWLAPRVCHPTHCLADSLWIASCRGTGLISPYLEELTRSTPCTTLSLCSQPVPFLKLLRGASPRLRCHQALSLSSVTGKWARGVPAERTNVLPRCPGLGSHTQGSARRSSLRLQSYRLCGAIRCGGRLLLCAKAAERHCNVPLPPSRRLALPGASGIPAHV